MTVRPLDQIHLLDGEQIQPFEWGDIEVQDLSLAETPAIRHPFLVTELTGDTFLLLGDAGYFHSLQQAGLCCFPVQVCPASAVRVSSRRLGLVRYREEDLRRLVSRHSERMHIAVSGRPDPDPAYLSLDFAFAGGSSVQVRLRDSSRSGCPSPLDALFRSILEHGSYFPLLGGRHSGAAMQPPAFSGTVDLPPFDLEDLRTAALTDRLFPRDIITAQTDCRILGVDFPVSVLTDSCPLDQKEAFLRDLIALRASRHRISYYEGEVYLLNP